MTPFINRSMLMQNAPGADPALLSARQCLSQRGCSI